MVKFYEKLNCFKLEPLNTNSDHRALTFSIMINVTKRAQPVKQKQGNSIRFYKFEFNMEAVSGLISSLSSENCSIIHEAFENCII